MMVGYGNLAIGRITMLMAIIGYPVFGLRPLILVYYGRPATGDLTMAFTCFTQDTGGRT